MQTTTTDTTDTNPLALVRSDAAARQRRATTYGFVAQQAPARGARRSIVGLVAASVMTLGLAGGALAQVVDQPLPQGYQVGCADGVYCPGEVDGNFSIADSDITPAPTRFSHGYQSGRPDGFWTQTTTPVVTAGDVAPASTSTVPPNVR